jgi:hypothetical protein
MQQHFARSGLRDYDTLSSFAQPPEPEASSPLPNPQNNQIESVPANRHSFHDDVFNTLLKSAESGENMFDVDDLFLHETADNWRSGCF